LTGDAVTGADPTKAHLTAGLTGDADLTGAGPDRAAKSDAPQVGQVCSRRAGFTRRPIVH
jgi:hypothetical protein